MGRRSHEGVWEMVALGTVGLLGTAALAWAYDHNGSYKESGVVHAGANGKEYVLPAGAKRPVYKTLGACVVDVTAQIKKIQDGTGEKVTEKPTDLCQPVSEYPASAYPRTYVYGPIVNGKSAWHSSKVAAWETTIPDGTFAATGQHVQDSLEPAPSGSHNGEHVSIHDPEKGGFGEHDDSGFHGNGVGINEEPHGGTGVHEEPEVPHIVVGER